MNHRLTPRWLAALLLFVCFVPGSMGAVRPQQPADKPPAPAANPADVGSMDQILAALYDVISGPAGQKRNWDRMRSLFLPEARLMATSKNQAGAFVRRVMSVEDYIARSGPMLENNGFFERETARKIESFGQIAHVFSTYEARQKADDPQPFMRGINSIQLLNDGQRWWIVTVFWQPENAEQPLPDRYLPSNQTVAFVNVNVVPMDRERIIDNQTVIVRNGRIADIGPATTTKAPDGALIVEGKGKFLMPGLAEMHGHLPGPNVSEATVNSLLFLFVANGVTTVRGMFGFPNHTTLREKVRRGEILGPTIYAASPALSGQSVHDKAAAQRLVREYKAAGFDLLKVHEGLSRENYDAIVAAAKEAGIAFGGHIADEVGLDHTLKSRQHSIEHLDGYLEALEADDSPIRNADPQTRAQQLVKYLDERKISKIAAAARNAGVWNVPTMALWQTFFGAETVDSLRQRPELKYVPPQMVNQWTQQRANQLQNTNDPAEGKRVIELRDKILKALADAGANILLGSDAPQLFSVPGFSLHREMKVMVQAGLTPYQVLASGTHQVAAYFNALDDFGTVSIGRQADLILLDDNPLKDVAHVAKRAGVMIHGRWLPEAEIQKRLEQIAASYAEKK